MTASSLQGNTVACNFAEWVSALSFEDLPDDVVRVAKECFRDAIACAILGSSVANTEYFLAAIRQVPKDGEATVILAPWRASVSDAVFINAIYTHGCELDDGFVGAGGHPSSVIIPVTLALAEQHHLSGREVITAIVAGYEIMHRATAAIHQHAMRRGFQCTGIGGPFGSTAAAAKLRGLPAQTIAQAFGIAGSYCCGLSEYDQNGGESKRLYPAITARAGIEAVEMAVAGVTGPLTIFEGLRGVWASFADHSDPDRSTGEFDSNFRILRHKVKTYPTVGVIHGGIEAIAELLEPPFHEADVETITIKVIPTSVHHGGTIQVPWDLLSAQFSLPYSAALRIHFGRNDLDLYQDAAIRSNPDVIALCQKVKVIAMTESDLKHEPDASAIATIALVDGTTRTHVQHAPTGTPDNPLTPQQLHSRFIDLTRHIISESVQSELDDAITHLDTLGTLDELLGMLGSNGEK